MNLRDRLNSLSEALNSLTLMIYGSMNRIRSMLKPLTLVRRFSVAFRPDPGKKHDASGTNLSKMLLLILVTKVSTNRIAHDASGPPIITF